ncbi:MAG TPA: carbamoyl-phosphate synthase large subunit, partial [Thermoanaerobaculia bacterium]|nr:carbamoyl-phosphate synthase large subunit [Thermoanaerobaculia bacterium]
WSIELIGASREAVRLAEDRDLFKQAMIEIGAEVPRSERARSVEDAERIARDIGLPLVVRPSFTLGGSGGGAARTPAEFRSIVRHGLAESPAHEVLIEESVEGWKEFELEVMRDHADNVIVVCSIENFDAMGVHTGDSITVAPQMTLSDRQYQQMRNEAKAIIRKIGVDTGGSNIQFAVEPKTGRRVVIEMNPRVSRSSALASKATGFPIAKIAALLAVGYTLDEIPNDITRKTPACFEPSLDYVVVKIPRWAFEKFPKADPTLTIQMKSVGEAMAIGRTFAEALGKAIRSLEIGRDGLDDGRAPLPPEELNAKLEVPTWERIFHVRRAFLAGMTVDEVAARTRIDPWFLDVIRKMVREETCLAGRQPGSLSSDELRRLKRLGLSDAAIGRAMGAGEAAIRGRRRELGVTPVFKTIDTCAAEFEAYTPYYYSTYEDENESIRTGKPKVVILGGGPNRIGQGIEFDYCCVHACYALADAGYETVMINCNPETVSTDYDTSDRLYFEPLTFEDVSAVLDNERPDGVLVQFGGQTPLKLARPLEAAGYPIWGTSPESIDLAEDRGRFGKLLAELGLEAPPHGEARTSDEAVAIARRIGYPLVVRPSYVLGGRAMAIVFDDEHLLAYMARALEAAPEYPILIDRFLDDAFEFDVDALSDGRKTWIGGIQEHIEKAGIHSGDSFSVLPAWKVSPEKLREMADATRRLAEALEVKGLMNIQFATQGGILYVLEVNPRASRTVPFVSKAIGVPMARAAALLAAGRSLDSLSLPPERPPVDYFIKAPVFPFRKFPGEDTLLGPEMKSTGEVMGISPRFGDAFAKACEAIGTYLPLGGTAFLTVNPYDKGTLLPIARELADLGFRLCATEGTRDALAQSGLDSELVHKVNEGSPNAVERMEAGEIQLVINTPLGGESHYHEAAIRAAALRLTIPCLTTLSAAAAAVEGIRARREEATGVAALQEYHRT